MIARLEYHNLGEIQCGRSSPNAECSAYSQRYRCCNSLHFVMGETQDSLNKM